MRILIISRTPWNNSNSFGNTFTNLFGGMEGVDIFNICCQSGSVANDVVKDTLQISESYLIRSVFRTNKKKSISNQKEVQSIVQMQSWGKKKRSAWMFIARDILWWLTSFLWKKQIISFVRKINPDLIYLPIYSSWYMCNVDSFVIKQLSVPVVGHISDDVYGYPPCLTIFSLSYFYRYRLREKVRSLINKTSYLEVFAENMKKTYERKFGKPCYLIGKGVYANDVNKPRICDWGNEVHFVYTGGIGGERFNVLLTFAKILSQIKSEKSCFLDIYSATLLSEKDKLVLLGVDSIVFHGAISGEEVKMVQSKADCLVHVEGFSKSAIFEAGMSFSTKIIDYLAKGRLLLAIGPEQVNSIQVLSKNNLAVVINDKDNICNVVEQLLNGEINVEGIQNNAYNYLINEKNISVIQNEMLQRMNNVCNLAS